MRTDQLSYTLKATRAFGATSVARGLFFTDAYALRANKLARLLSPPLPSVSVTPGKEAVLVLDVPNDTDVRSPDIRNHLGVDGENAPRG